MTKVAIIGSVGVPARYGGFETLADQLVQHLSEKIDITVYCSKHQYTRRLDKYYNAKVKYVALQANGVQSIPYDIISILRSFRDNDVLLILGVAGVFVLPFIKWFSKVKVIVHIDGMEWKREKWNRYAKAYLRYAELISFKVADRIVADNQAIMTNIDSQYHDKTEFIAYGTDHVVKSSLEAKLLSKLEIRSKRYAFSVCRIVPENNVLMIIEAFEKLNMDLVIVGNWYDSEYGISIWQRYLDCEHIYLINPIYNQKELDSLRSNCELYIHGHSAGRN